MHADSVDDMSHPTNASESYLDDRSAVISRFLQALPADFDLSDSVEQYNTFYTVAGGYYNLYHGHSRRHGRDVAIRSLRLNDGEPAAESLKNVGRDVPPLESVLV